MIAARFPSVRRMWYSAVETEVFPLVPVTPIRCRLFWGLCCAAKQSAAYAALPVVYRKARHGAVFRARSRVFNYQRRGTAPQSLLNAAVPICPLAAICNKAGAGGNGGCVFFHD